jgi:hypothetical protein
MNPQSVIKVMAAINTFRTNHPKFASFVQIMLNRGVEEDTIIEVTVTRPGEEPLTANMKVTQSDLELIGALKELRS